MSLVVMAHPERAHLALPLARRVAADNVVFDPGFDPGGLLPYRDGPPIEPNALRCARWAWREAATGPEDWACVLQDDVLAPLGFRPPFIQDVYREAQEHGPSVVSFYYGAQSATGQRVRSSFLRTDGAHGLVAKMQGEYLSTVAAVAPKGVVHDWLAFSRLPYWSTNARDDECWGAFLDSRPDLGAFATYPCYIGHDDDVPSVAGNSDHGPRRAAVPPPERVPAW